MHSGTFIQLVLDPGLVAQQQFVSKDFTQQRTLLDNLVFTVLLSI